MVLPRRKSSRPFERHCAWQTLLALVVTLWFACFYAYLHAYPVTDGSAETPAPRSGNSVEQDNVRRQKAADDERLRQQVVQAMSTGNAAGALPLASGATKTLQGIDTLDRHLLPAPAGTPAPPPPPTPLPVRLPVLPKALADKKMGIVAADAWSKLLNQEIQVEYMRQRMQERSESWLQALAGLSPPWEQPRRLEGDGINRALVWPAAAYQHFGVTRVWSLGEYAQWADLCASLATLGYEVQLWPWHGQSKDYPTQKEYDRATAVFTDYDGVHGGWRFGARPPADKTWILDTFGTDGTVVQHGFFGRQKPMTDYPLSRFLTLVPGYATRNGFLGVAVVDSASKDADAPKDANVARPPKREWRCVLWSKVQPWLMWKSEPWHKSVLQEFTKHCHVVATVDKKDTYHTEDLIRECCPEVEIRGVATTHGFAELLRTSAVYVGVGEPLIAPSCFEALSLGTHVVQPRFPKPKVLPNKPITQAWTSQHPFLEQVPEPFAYTVDPLDPAAIAEAFRKIKASFNSVFVDEPAQGSTAVDTLRNFYAHGEYPLREVYSMPGFLGRVARIARETHKLVPSDWEWEKGHHPDKLPQRAFQVDGALG